MTLGEMIEIASKEAGISPHLLAEVVRQESGGRWWVVSPKGAGGLGQLMPGTAARFGVRDRFDPMQNLRGSARYLRVLLDLFDGNVPSVLAAYNSGEATVQAYLSGRTVVLSNGKVINPRGIRTPQGIPPYRETQNYVRTIYPRFVASATNGRPLPRVTLTAHTSLRPPSTQPSPAPPSSEPLAKVQQAEAQTAPDEGARNSGASVYFFKPPASVSPSVLPK